MVFAQGKNATPDSSSSAYRMNTIFGCSHGKPHIPLGYFVEFDAGYTRFGHHNVFLPGISAGIILNHHWTIGMTGSFIGNPQGLHMHHGHSDSTGQQNSSANLKGGFGGALFEYTLFPKSRVHVSFPLMIGGGYMYWSQVHYPNGSSKYYHPFNFGNSFFVIEPGVKMELNMSKMLRLGLGVSYRYAPDPDLKYASENFINQFTLKLSLRFGKF